MNRMTCRPRLRQRLRRGENGFVVVAAICLGLMVTTARGGTLDAPAAPTNANSAIYTLEDIYNKLNTRTNVAKRMGAFTEPTGGPTNGTMHTLNDIMTLVTNRSPVQKTGQTTSYVPYDDGWYSTNKGVARPNPRFTVQSTNAPGSPDDRTNCVLDNLTGLMWARNANIASNLGWSASGAVDWTNTFNVITNGTTGVNGIVYGGYNDWRVPNFRELRSLIDHSWTNPAVCNIAGTGKCAENDPFTGVQNASYWSSTKYHCCDHQAWRVALNYGAANVTLRTSSYYVWPVRGGGQ